MGVMELDPKKFKFYFTPMTEAIKRGEKQLAENRKARHDYFIEDTYECGIALVGTGQGPDMYELSAFLGKEETLRRTKRAIDLLGS